MKSKLLILFLLCISGAIYCQPANKSRQFIKKAEAARAEIKNGNYQNALPILKELWEIDSSSGDVNWMTGLCIYNMKRESQESMPYFLRASIRFPESYYYLGRLYHNASLLDKALESYLEYKNSAPDPVLNNPDIDQQIEKSYTAKKMMRSPVPVAINLMNGEVNSVFSDYSPLLSPDGSVIYFTSRREGSTGSKKDINNEYFEDIYRTTFSSGKWSNPENIGLPVNTETHDAAVTISKDGSILYIYRTSPVNPAGGDIYLSEFTNNTWSEPVKLDANINTPGGAETSISISPDGNTIYFSSNRPGGFGGKDLYRVTRMPDNNWSRAMNLGPGINTAYDEDGPFIHPDGHSFYFSSAGHENMGGFDIFKSTLGEDGSLSAPVNIGYPVNSVRDDIFYFVTHDAKKAYFSSNREGGKGFMDIYQTDIADDEQKNLIMLKGTVTTNEPEFKSLKATITIIDIMTNDLQGIYKTGPNGKYLIVLVPRKKYKVIIEAKGYYSHIDDIDLTEKLQMDDLFKSINLKKEVKPGDLIPQEQPENTVPENNK